MTGLIEAVWAAIPACVRCVDGDAKSQPAKQPVMDYSGEVAFEQDADFDISHEDFDISQSSTSFLPGQSERRRSQTETDASTYDSRTSSAATISASMPGFESSDGDMEAKKQRWQARRQDRQKKKGERLTGAVTYGQMLRNHGWMLQWRLSNQMLCELMGMLSERGIEVTKMEPIGSGRFARVFRACWHIENEEHQKLSVDVALKWMRPTMPNVVPEGRVSRPEGSISGTPVWLKREVEANQAVQHPHLVNMLHSVLNQQPYLILLEYCAGGSLDNLVHGSPANEKTVSSSTRCPDGRQQLKIALDISAGMEHLHSLHLIHRDLKPPNVLLQSPVDKLSVEPHAKVGDFGLARFMEEDVTLGMSVEVGSMAYIAPEMCRRGGSCEFDEDTKRYSEKVDVYSYAMVLYELLARATPFAEVLTGLNTLVASGVRPKESLLPEDADPVLSAFMRACWAQLPADRPAFSDITAALSHAYSGSWTAASEISDMALLRHKESVKSLMSIPEGASV
mmetsp:Transcript_45230/g.104885  ORF Transcript_45230/g.104885 Transcript_45230/m.104885 type:complete len:509 (-) Transcript_45230:47-1573(-)